MTEAQQDAELARLQGHITELYSRINDTNARGTRLVNKLQQGINGIVEWLHPL